MIQKITVTHLSELVSVIPSNCHQIAAVFNNGAWDVAYVAAPTEVEPAPA